MKNAIFWTTYALTLLLLNLSPLCNAKTIEGRVELIEEGEQPRLSEQLLHAGVSTGGFPEEMRGTWYGDVEIAQIETYPQLHSSSAYWTEFVRQAGALFTVHRPGKIVLQFKKDKDGRVHLLSSDAVMRGRMKLQFTSGRGPALIPGGFNEPNTITNLITVQSDSSVEQTRVDQVNIVASNGAVIQRGLSEISALYRRTEPRKMAVKILEIDYDEQGQPLWKILLRGTATR